MLSEYNVGHVSKTLTLLFITAFIESFWWLQTPTKINFPTEAFWVQMLNLPLCCIYTEIGKHICNTIGVFKNCDVKDDGSGWGVVLRVCIEMELQKPTARGRTLNIKDSKIWVPLTNVKLSRLCFRCGRIVHGQEFCKRETASPKFSNDQFGPWLRTNTGRISGKSSVYNYSSSSTKKIEYSNREKNEEAPPKGAKLGEALGIWGKTKSILDKSSANLETFPNWPLELCMASPIWSLKHKWSSS